jgi:ferredoxin--NADP+ reductase
MHKVLYKEPIAPDTYDLWFSHPSIHARAKPGQFVIIRTDEHGERIPLTIASTEEGKVRVIVKAVGKSTFKICGLKVGDSVVDIVGPLGNPSEIDKFGTVCVVGGGVGIAPLFPVTRALKEAGNRVLGILGAANSDSIIMLDEFEPYLDRLFITTDDGSRGIKGPVTEALKTILSDDPPDIIWAIGPMVMMKFVSLLAAQRDLRCWVSLNPIMVDGTGMCGACRAEVNGEMRFACVHGPEFDGRTVSWNELIKRQYQYREEEKLALEHYIRETGERNAR